MSGRIKVVVGGSAKEDAADFVLAWERLEQGKAVTPQTVLAFESWEGLASILTPERYRLLRRLHAHPEESISALARALDRQYSRVHADVAALAEAGLLERSSGHLRTTADRIIAEIQL